MHGPAVGPAVRTGATVMSKSQHLRAGAVRHQPEGSIEGWRERRSGSMCVDYEEPEEALAHGSFRQTGDATLPIVSSGGAPLRKPGLKAAGRPGGQGAAVRAG